MIRSMTGFGRASFEIEGGRFDVEVRCLNHRHLDLSVRLPRALGALEPELRSRVGERFARGKVDLAVSGGAGSGLPPRLELDLEAVGQYVTAAAALRDRFGLAGTLDVATALSLPGVARVGERELPLERLRELLWAAVETALASADAMRRTEGAALEREMRGRLDRLRELAEALEARADVVQAAVRERLRKRSEQLRQETGLLDEARLAQEIVIAADRLDVREELVRLRSHLEQFAAVLDASGPRQPAGRRLDFLLQELGREVNTAGSKGGDAAVAHLVVELKTELERIREQVQNVE